MFLIGSLSPENLGINTSITKEGTEDSLNRNVNIKFAKYRYQTWT